VDAASAKNLLLQFARNPIIVGRKVVNAWKASSSVVYRIQRALCGVIESAKEKSAVAAFLILLHNQKLASTPQRDLASIAEANASREKSARTSLR